MSMKCGSYGYGSGDGSCVANANYVAGIEILGENLRAALAELFMVGGTLELGLVIEVTADCGEIEKIVLKADGECVAKMAK